MHYVNRRIIEKYTIRYTFNVIFYSLYNYTQWSTSRHPLSFQGLQQIGRISRYRGWHIFIMKKESTCLLLRHKQWRHCMIAQLLAFFSFYPPSPPPFVISPLQAHPKDLAHRELVVGVNINIQHINPGIVFPRDRQTINRLTVSKFTMSLNDLNPGAFNKP